MKVTLYMAVSADGFIADKHGDSDWVSVTDTKIFNQKIKDLGCLIVGRKTFEQYLGELYPVSGVLNIVLTSKRAPSKDENTIFVNSPTEALFIAKSKGFESVLLIGGGKTNGSFHSEKLIDEVYFDIHPLILGEGIKVFEKTDTKTGLELIDSVDLGEGQRLLHYKVKK